MKMIVGLLVAATMMVFVFGAIAAKLATGGARALIGPGLVLAGFLAAAGAFEAGALDATLWDVTMPEIPAEQSRFIHAAHAGSAGCSDATIAGWVGKVDYALSYEGKPAIAVRIDSHMVLRSAYMAKDGVAPGSPPIAGLETGQFVHIGAALPVTAACPKGAVVPRSTEAGDTEAVVEFTSIKPF